MYDWRTGYTLTTLQTGTAVLTLAGGETRRIQVTRYNYDDAYQAWDHGRDVVLFECGELPGTKATRHQFANEKVTAMTFKVDL